MDTELARMIRHEGIVAFRAPTRNARCHCRVLAALDKPTVVIVSELVRYEGMSVTNGAEQIAEAVLRDVVPETRLEEIVWVEHWPPGALTSRLAEETFDRVRFLPRATWQHTDAPALARETGYPERLFHVPPHAP